MAIEPYNIKDLNVTSNFTISSSPVITSNGANQIIMNSGVTGDIGLLLTSNTKAVTLEVATNQQLTVRGGLHSFIFDVSSGTGGLQFPDGTIQNTAAGGGGGVPAGTVTGTMLKWDGAAWVETTSATGEILVSADNELTINDGATTTANIVMTANDGSTNPSIILTGNGGFPILQIESLSSSTYCIHNQFGNLSFYSDTGSVAIGSGGRGSLQWQAYTGQITQTALKSADAGSGVGVVTLPKDFLFNNSLPTYYQERDQNSEGRFATWLGLDNYAIANTTNNIADAVYVDLGAQSPDQQTFSASWPFYRFDVYYINTTDGTNEHITVHLLHDGTTIADTDFAYLGTTASREIQYTTRYNAGSLQIGFWSASTAKSVKFYIRAVSGGGMA